MTVLTIARQFLFAFVCLCVCVCMCVLACTCVCLRGVRGGGNPWVAKIDVIFSIVTADEVEAVM